MVAESVAAKIFKIGSVVFELWPFYLRGRPFDSEGGGGGLALLVGTDYLFSSRARSENSFPGKSGTEYLFSTATNFLKAKKKKKWGGGGAECEG